MKVTVEVPVDVDAMEARIEARLEARLLAAVEARLEKAAPPERVYLRVAQFCERHGVSKRTTTKFLSEGLPHVGRGKLLRIPVLQGDAWIASRGSTIG